MGLAFGQYLCCHGDGAVGQIGDGVVGEADDDAMGQAWHVPNAPELTMREVLQMFAKAVGKKLKISVMPSVMTSISASRFTATCSRTRRSRWPGRWSPID